MFARFDDLRPGREAGWELHQPLRAISTRRLERVASELAAAERAARDGWWVAGFVTYDAAGAFDPALTVPVGGGDGLPLVWFGVFGERREVRPLTRGKPGVGYATGSWSASISPADHADAVEAIRTRIAAGDVYQVNLTARLHASFRGDPFAFYRDVACAQRGAYHAFIDTGGHQVVSASPELFIELRGDRVETRPMKGTARRGRWGDEDRAGATALLSSPKERAENVMVADMLRNDVGRVAVTGSVGVDELCGLERFDTVWQLTTTISGRLPDSTTVGDVFRALFPCGSVTGAPKVSAMRTITELETESRGLYCGAVGYLAPGGHEPRACFAVAIRTAVVNPGVGTVTYGTGGGITWDSDPAGEYAELLLKARVLTERRPAFELLETMRFAEAAGIPLLGAHLDRMVASADYFGYRFERRELLDHLGRALAGQVTPARVRLRVAPDGTAAVDVAALPESPPGPVRLVVHEEPISTDDVLRFHKTTHRLPYDRARRQHPEADDVVLVNEHGHVAETCIATIAAFVDGGWFTPPVDAGCLPGVARRLALDCGWLRERDLRVGDLWRADRLLVGNALRGWRAATLLGVPCGPDLS